VTNPLPRGSIALTDATGYACDGHVNSAAPPR
jgi:hypothetical protein